MTARIGSTKSHMTATDLGSSATAIVYGCSPERLQLDQPISVDRGSRAEERTKQFVMHGEAVILRADGIADFNAPHSRKHDDEVQLDAFDILALDGDDPRDLSRVPQQ